MPSSQDASHFEQRCHSRSVVVRAVMHAARAVGVQGAESAVPEVVVVGPHDDDLARQSP